MTVAVKGVSGPSDQLRDRPDANADFRHEMKKFDTGGAAD